MAKPKTEHVAQKTRDKIQATKLVEKLQDHVLGEVELTPTQIKAIQILINKVMPDMRAIELTGKDGEAIETRELSNTERLQRISWLLEQARARGVGKAANSDAGQVDPATGSADASV